MGGMSGAGPASFARGAPTAVRLRRRLAEAGLDATTLLILPALGFTFALFVYPALYGLWLSFRPMHGGWLANYRTFFGDPYLYRTIVTTLEIAIPVTVLNMVVAVPVALQVRHFRWQRALTTILVIPITLGTVLIAQGLLNYLGPLGWLNRVLMGLGITAAPLRLLHNYWGLFISQVIGGFPFAFLLILSYVTGIDPSLEHAGAMLGAGPRQRFRAILLPLLGSGLATTFCLSFVQVFSVFPSAVLVGAPAGETRVIAIAAYHAAYEEYDYSMGSAIAIIMAVVQVVIVVLVLKGQSRLYRGPAAGGKG
jgi:putative spermidine/putrescine transport system permease protein